MLKLLYNLFKTTLVFIFCIFLSKNHNIFEIIEFIPREYVFETGITIYFLIIDSACDWIEEWFIDKFVSSIDCVFFKDKSSENIENTPEINFENEVSNINISISFAGNSKKISKKKIKIPFPDWIEVQLPSNSKWMIDNKNVLILDFEKIINENLEGFTNQKKEIKINFIRNICGDNNSIDILPKLERTLFVKFKKNKLIIKNY